MNVLRSWCWSRHLGNILKQMAPQELDKILSIESFAEVTKRNGDDNELDSLKIMPLNGMKEKKTHHPLGIVHSSEFHNSKEIHRRITQDAPQIPFPKTMKSLSLNHRRRKGLPSLIQATRIELLYLK